MLTPLFNASPSRLAIWLALTFFGYSLVRVIHRIFFHPLARVPGPKLAAATLLYQTYYSFAGSRSRFYIQIAKLHQAYGKWFCPGAADPVPLVLGPIVRISPDEVHLSDAENYDKIYHVGSKYSKDGKFYGGFSNPNSMFTTPSNELHRTRRAVLNNFFSRKSVLDLEDVVQEKVQILMEHVSKALASGTALDVHHGLRAVSIDVITDYAFGQSYGLLDQPDLGLEFSTLVHRLGPAAWVFRQWPWLSPIVMAIPKSVIYFINKPMGFVRELQIHCQHRIDDLLAARKSATSTEGRPTIFSSLLPASGVPDRMTRTVVGDEAYTVLTAAADTTGNAMTTITHYVLSDRMIYNKLHAELKAVFPSDTMILDFASLERLPYLSNVIKEGLRLSFGVPGRLPRVVPDDGAVFHSYCLPAGTVVSMSSWLLHHDETYFPNPTKFDPDRWGDATDAHKMEKAFVPFCKGSRACLGMNLAYCELYVSIGTLFRRFPNLTSNNLSGEELAYDDYFSSYTPLGQRKLHIMSALESKKD